MLKTNTKIVNKRIEDHILSYYSLEDLKEELKAVSYGSIVGSYQAGIKLTEGGCFLIYYDHIREFLKEVLEETEEESQKYSDEALWVCYKNQIGKACERLTKN